LVTAIRLVLAGGRIDFDRRHGVRLGSSSSRQWSADCSCPEGEPGARNGGSQHQHHLPWRQRATTTAAAEEGDRELDQPGRQTDQCHDESQPTDQPRGQAERQEADFDRTK
jgi:hypothetical protein